MSVRRVNNWGSTLISHKEAHKAQEVKPFVLCAFVAVIHVEARVGLNVSP